MGERSDVMWDVKAAAYLAVEKVDSRVESKEKSKDVMSALRVPSLAVMTDDYLAAYSVVGSAAPSDGIRAEK